MAQFEDESFDQACKAVIHCQEPLNRETHRVPEPWSGHIDRCRILFFGSNPSIDSAEVFPTLIWENENIEDFFENRFAGGHREWVDSKCRVLRTDGTHGPTRNWVRFWASCRARASELLGRPARMGEDFAISEVVHCKSKGERKEGLRVTDLASEVCSDRYVTRIIAASAARVILPMGVIASREIRRIFSIPADTRFFGPEIVANVQRFFAFLDHPAGPGRRKKFRAALDRGELDRLRDAVSGNEAVDEYAADLPWR